MIKKIAKVVGWTLIWGMGLAFLVALPILAILAGNISAGPVLVLGADIMLAGVGLLIWSDT